MQLLSETSIRAESMWKKSRSFCDTVTGNRVRDAATSDIFVRMTASHVLVNKLVYFKEAINGNLVFESGHSQPTHQRAHLQENSQSECTHWSEISHPASSASRHRMVIARIKVFSRSSFFNCSKATRESLRMNTAKGAQQSKFCRAGRVAANPAVVEVADRCGRC